MSTATVVTLRTLGELEQTIVDANRAEYWPEVVERARHVGRKEAFFQAADIVEEDEGGLEGDERVGLPGPVASGESERGARSGEGAGEA